MKKKNKIWQMYMTLNKLYNLHNLPLQACPWELCICNLFQSLCRASECTADSTGFHSPVFSIWQSDSCLHSPLWCNNHKALRMKIISHNSHGNKHYKTAVCTPPPYLDWWPSSCRKDRKCIGCAGDGVGRLATETRPYACPHEARFQLWNYSIG